MSWSSFLKLQWLPDFIIGCDEVGTGALAGPAVVAAVAYPFSWEGLEDLRDSKLYSNTSKGKEEREGIAEQVFQTATVFSLEYVSVTAIELLGVHNSVLQSHGRVINECRSLLPKGSTAIAIVDGIHRPPGVGIHVRAIPKADSLIPAVSAASVMGKVERDWWMHQAHYKYPVYNFASNVGYGTRQHYSALAMQGPCELHRKTFGPIKKMLEVA